MWKKSITNKFSQMITCSKKSNEKEQAGSHKNLRKQTLTFEKNQEILSTNLLINDINMKQRKSIESLTSDIDIGDSGKDYGSIATKVLTTS
ncbi:582_t:CDS:2 [Funneliformis mosseae]|uniref:582_t:CDS:1 n=1 Tax=Funneliformis mosseae TaxID=27381 RepID=A0A9N8WK94_FUNMO|nr:582_t:CDS:2 [Funneliformis mosseae]